MFELILLPRNGNPETDWMVYAKHYKRHGNAKRAMWRLMHTNSYQALILRDETLQPDRQDLIRRMNDHLNSDYYKALCKGVS
ncbi:MAG: hypothetical protein J6Y20_10135 [Lachnospiraceae bacterium]|nr:hypothetical protein [Lachnospiraceae bacterium]MBP5462472.1 hypothetical protein [Lachnospiraceae bacterium]